MCILEVIRLFQSVGCVRNKLQFHSSTESEIISLDARLRLDGITALDLWDLIVLVLGNTTHNHDRNGKPVVCRDKNHVRQQSRGMGTSTVRPVSDKLVIDIDMDSDTAAESDLSLYESQFLLNSWNEQQPRTERPVKDTYSSSYSEWNADEKWFLKSGNPMK